MWRSHLLNISCVAKFAWLGWPARNWSQILDTEDLLKEFFLRGQLSWYGVRRRPGAARQENLDDSLVKHVLLLNFFWVTPANGVLAQTAQT